MASSHPPLATPSSASSWSSSPFVLAHPFPLLHIPHTACLSLSSSPGPSFPSPSLQLLSVTTFDRYIRNKFRDIIKSPTVRLPACSVAAGRAVTGVVIVVDAATLVSWDSQPGEDLLSGFNCTFMAPQNGCLFAVVDAHSSPPSPTTACMVFVVHLIHPTLSPPRPLRSFPRLLLLFLAWPLPPLLSGSAEVSGHELLLPRLPY